MLAIPFETVLQTKIPSKHNYPNLGCSKMGASLFFRRKQWGTARKTANRLGSPDFAGDPFAIFFGKVEGMRLLVKAKCGWHKVETDQDSELATAEEDLGK